MNEKQTEILNKIGELFIELSKSFEETPALAVSTPPPNNRLSAESKTIETKPIPVEPLPHIPPPLPDISFVDMIKGDLWPKAVEDNAIVVSEEDKYERAEGIIDLMIEHHVEKIKFLDFGCGEGHVSKTILSQKPTLSVGYDIVKPDNEIVPWGTKNDNLLLTTDLQQVRNEKPYDIILIYDVLDHAENPIELLKEVEALSHQKTKIFVRCHPWCSRHGGHLYQSLNKAYAHMFLSDEEILQLTGKPPMFCQKVLFPQITYQNWFKQIGFNVRHENTDKSVIEPFFMSNETVSKAVLKIFSKQASGPAKQFPKHQLEQSFLDYVLLPK